MVKKTIYSETSGPKIRQRQLLGIASFWIVRTCPNHKKQFSVMISFATPWWITEIDESAGTFVTALRTCPYVANGYRGGSLLGWSYVRLRETTRILNYDHNRFAMSSLCCNVLQFPGMVIPCKFIEDLKDTAIWDVQLAPPAGPSLFGGSGRLARNIFDDDDDVVKQDGGVRTIELKALFVAPFGVVYRSHRWDYCPRSSIV